MSDLSEMIDIVSREASVGSLPGEVGAPRKFANSY